MFNIDVVVVEVANCSITIEEGEEVVVVNN